jgi:phospholipid/cholesterol/gamma-HCH transport system substrate-binding protein
MKFSKEVKIAITTIICLVLLYIGVNYLKGINLFKPANYYHVSCKNIRDISISSPVFVEGFKVGLVRSIVYDYSTTENITLEISLDKGMKINKGSYIMIEQTLLSGAQLNIMLNNYVDEYMEPGEMLEGRLKGGMMDAVEKDILPNISVLLPKIDSILSGLQILLNSPALVNTFNNLENTTKQLDMSSRHLNSLLSNDIPDIAGSLKSTASNLSTFTNGLNKLELDKSINKLNTSLDNLGMFTNKINSKDNSIGLLLNDTLMYKNLNGTLENASILLNDLKENPKRYVGFSLF